MPTPKYNVMTPEDYINKVRQEKMADISFHPEDEQAARHLDAEDEMIGEQFGNYLDRLLKADKFIADHMRYPDNERERKVRRKILQSSGLAGGITQYWSNPEAFHIPGTEILPAEKDVQKEYGSGMQGYMYGSEPKRIYINEKGKAGHPQPFSRVLPHEATHQRYNQYRKHITPSMPDIEPKFSDEFKTRAEKAQQTVGSPFHGHGFGTDPDETMAYLLGREGQRRPKQKIEDDLHIRLMFGGLQADWDQYRHSRNLIRNSKFK